MKTQRLGLCPACSRQSVRYERDRIEVISCPACGWFMTSRQKDYQTTHDLCFPPTPDPPGYWDSRYAISPGALVVRGPAGPDDPRR